MPKKSDVTRLVPADPDALVRKPPELGQHPMAILSAGTPDRVRTVAATWAGLVVYWGQPSAVVLTRTSRYVREFCQQHKRIAISVLPGSQVPELRAGNSPQGPLPQTPIASVRPLEVGGLVAFGGAELVLGCKIGVASEMSDDLRELLAPTQAELKRLGRQTSIIAYVERAWQRGSSRPL